MPDENKIEEERQIIKEGMAEIHKREQRKITFCAVSLVNIAKDLKLNHPLISSICETLAKSLASEIEELPEARLHSQHNFHNTKIDEEIESIVKEIRKDE